MEINEINPFTVRPYDKDLDQVTVEEWISEHGQVMFHPGYFPPLSAVACDSEGIAAGVWVHLSLNCGQAILEPAISRPGLSIKQARQAFTLCIEALKQAARDIDYGVLLVHTKPAIARYLSLMGFRETSREVKVDLFFDLNSIPKTPTS